MDKELSEIKKIEEDRFKVIQELEKDPLLGYESMKDVYEDYKITSNVETLGRLLNRENVFISGPAGSGKTTLIRKFMEIIDADSRGKVNVALTASTGIAAQLIEGRTIHSWSGLGIMTKPFERHDVPGLVFHRLPDLRSVDVLVIDEISMLPAYFFKNLNSLLKWAKRSDAPFGGVQMIVSGDFQQLSPVDKDKELNNDFAITTSDWKEADFSYCYMDRLHRAEDRKLQYLLETISRGEITEITEALINSRMVPNAEIDPEKTYTTLFTTNRNVDRYNEEKLDALDTAEKSYSFPSFGDEKDVKALYRQNNIPETLTLKVGATVMLTTNIPNKGLSNGSIGKVISLSGKDSRPMVKFNNGQTIKINPKSYFKKEKVERESLEEPGKSMSYETTVAGIKQLPLRLAWAITVHKSQGQVFDGVIADLSNIFAPSLGYIAMSRVRDLEDLIITSFSEDAYNIDEKARKISNYTKKRAMLDREEFIENEDQYLTLLEYTLYRQLHWGDAYEE